MSRITAVIRYKDSAKTLPEVLESLRMQTHTVDHIIAVDTGSTDGSTQILTEAGAQIVKWDKPYHHSEVTNFGFSHCETPFILCLSSHTSLNDNTIIARLYQSLTNANVAACSIRWDDDSYYSDAIDLAEITEKGLKLGSIYTNSLGLIRKSCWDAYKFDETFNGVEDYDWALHQLEAGYTISRIRGGINYRRNGHNRVLRATARVFFIAERHNLSVKWFGRVASSKEMLRNLPGKLMKKPEAVEAFDLHARRLLGSLFWRFMNLNLN